MNISIENIPSSKIAYIRRVGAYGAENVQTMEQIKQWAVSRDLMNHKTVIFGIAHDNAQTTPQENCRYDACVLLEDKAFSADGDVQYGEIPAGKYAIFAIEHTAEAVGRAWGKIFPTLSEMHFSLDSTRPILERYAVEMVEQHLCEICVPIEE